MTKATSNSKRAFGTAEQRRAANALAAQYRVVITSHGSKGYVGCTVEMPMVLGRGMTEAECFANTRQAAADTIVLILQKGEKPPSPASLGKREVQLNIRLTADERLRIAERARQAGFRSVSDYIRRAALRGVA